MKYLLLLLIIAALWWSWKKRQPAAPTRPRSPAEVRTINCAQCGVHFPADEAVHGADRVFCSEAHRQAWRDG